LSLMSDLDGSIENKNKEQRKAMKELDEAKKEERTQQEKLDEEAKELEKMSNKQTMLIKKVSFLLCFLSHVFMYQGVYNSWKSWISPGI